MAGRLIRGTVYLCRFRAPDKERPAVVLTRDPSIGNLSSVTVAPITSTIRGARSEVSLDAGDGMTGLCVINLHNVVTIPQSWMGRQVATLSEEKMHEVCAVLRFSLGCL